jgi:predicted SnoaL-like aldol condensation-catalyzing enzyme
MLKTLSTAVLSLGLALGATTAMSDGVTNKDLVKAGLKAVFVDFDPDAAKRLFREVYIQHNPKVPTGLAPLLGVLPVLKEAGFAPTHHRFIADGDLVAVHTTYENAQLFGADTIVAFDIFRVEDGLIAEHWDNEMAMTPPNPSGRTLTDGPTAITDLDKTEENKALVRSLVERVLIGGDAGALPEQISTETYHQHNPHIADGLDGLGAALTALAEQDNMFVYDRLHMVVGEGNFVVTASEGSWGGKPTAFYDMFRVEDGKVVEHWDVISEIPAEFAHENGKF